MQRIVDGIAFEGKQCPDSWDIRVWDHGGHREISARPVVIWSEIGPAPDWSHLGEKDPGRDAADEAERKEKNQRRAAMRAKTLCRRFIKMAGFNEMLTLTYKENQQDEALCKRHFKEWVRRMRVVLGGRFGFCAGFEPQQRGAWHVHCSTHKLPAKVTYKGRTLDGWRVGTAIWRAVVGDLGGMCFVGGKGKNLGQSVAKMAAYVSKYILKHWELMPEGKNRYSHSEGVEVPKAEVVRMHGVNLVELIGRCFWVDAGEGIVSHRVGRFKDSYYLCTESLPLPLSEG